MADSIIIVQGTTTTLVNDTGSTASVAQCAASANAADTFAAEAVTSEESAAESAAAAAISEENAAISAANALASEEAAALNTDIVFFDTKAAMDADLAHDAGTRAKVRKDSTAANNIYYSKLLASGAGSWDPDADPYLPDNSVSTEKIASKAVTTDKIDDDAVTPDQANFFEPGKNKYDKSIVDLTHYWSNSNVMLKTNGAVAIINSGPMPVNEGLTYVFTAVGTGIGGYLDVNKAPIQNVTGVVTLSTNSKKFTVPTGLGIKYVAMNMTKNVNAENAAQLEIGTVATAYEAHKKVIAENVLYLPDMAKESVYGQYLVSRNLIDKDLIDTANYYSVTNNAVQARGAVQLCLSNYMPVTEAKKYVISGNGAGGLGTSGGFFNASRVAVTPITLDSSTLTNNGVFTVPEGLSIAYVALNVRIGSEATAQMQEGDQETAYVEHSEKFINADMLNREVSASAEDEPEEVNTITYPGIYKKFIKFFKHWLRRDKGLLVVIWGDSICARDTHTTYYSTAEQSVRPPLMVSKNLASKLFDLLDWGNCKYRRYDATGVFTEVGTFATVTGATYGWDDIVARPSWTRYISSADSKSVAYSIPIGARISNFIYRTMADGAEVNTVTIAEGDDKVEAFDGTDWVEANGFVFSMLHVDTGAYTGNTKYQERLKMRCKSELIDSRANAKAVTITKTSEGSFGYWGIEYSEDENILTVVNAARGSHSIEALTEYMNDDVYGFNPDLIFFQVPIMNLGVPYEAENVPQYNVDRIDNILFDETNPQSLIEHSKVGGTPWQNFEVICWMPHFSIATLAVSEAGEFLRWVPANSTTGESVDIRDYYHAFAPLFLEHDGVAYINLFDRMVEEGIALFGNVYDAFNGSGVIGETFTDDDTHQNNTGTNKMWKYLSPAFDKTAIY